MSMTTSLANSDCRMYEARYPEVNTPVMIQVKEIRDVATRYLYLVVVAAGFGGDGGWIL
ncbi:hypothetical protein Hanom_Chr11g01000201 [Helianthus anomalus]